jgi:alkylation response protein AidB-like acyl-CoA dehydrogenase
VLESAIVQLDIARWGAGMAGRSLTAHHPFIATPFVVSCSETQKRESLPRVTAGEVQVAAGVTESGGGHRPPNRYSPAPRARLAATSPTAPTNRTITVP